MDNGLAIIEKTDTETRGFYIDQDALEFARQNAKVNKRLSQAAEEKKLQDRKCRKVAAANAKKKHYTASAVRTILGRSAICAALVWAGAVGMVHPAIAVPVSLGFLCATFLRLGVLLGKVGK